MSATRELIAAALTAADELDSAYKFMHCCLHPHASVLREACARAMVQPAAPDGWQPIETMPRDGGTYLVAASGCGLVAPHIQGVIHNNPGTAWDWQYGEAVTHWMPLPEAPK